MTDQLLYRLDEEYQMYRWSILDLSNNEIFSKAYEIDIINNFYNILQECINELPDNTVARLLETDNILIKLYEEWLKVDDGIYDELISFVIEKIDMVSTM